MKASVLLGVMLAIAAAQVAAGESEVRNTAESISKGKLLYMTMCKECHGMNGKSQTDVIADSEDISDPAAYRNGSNNQAIDRAIGDGAGAGMPAFRGTLKSDDDIIHMRHFIQSLWPAARRPAVVE